MSEKQIVWIIIIALLTGFWWVMFNIMEMVVPTIKALF